MRSQAGAWERGENPPVSPFRKGGEERATRRSAPYIRVDVNAGCLLVVCWADTQVRAYPTSRGTFGSVGDSASHLGVFCGGRRKLSSRT